MYAASFFGIVSVVILTSCGPSVQETEQALLKQIAERQRLEASLDGTVELIAEAKETIIQEKDMLAVEQVRLSRIKSWQFGRTAEVRDRRIMDQTRRIIELTAYIQEWEERLQHLQVQHADQTQALQKTAFVEAKMSLAGVR